MQIQTAVSATALAAAYLQTNDDRTPARQPLIKTARSSTAPALQTADVSTTAPGANSVAELARDFAYSTYQPLRDLARPEMRLAAGDANAAARLRQERIAIYEAAKAAGVPPEQIMQRLLNYVAQQSPTDQQAISWPRSGSLLNSAA